MGTVYFIRETVSGHVKIGWTSGRPASRLKALQTAHPHDLVLICSIPGDKATERALHEKYAHLRLRGEWFRYDTDLRELIVAQVAADAGKADKYRGGTSAKFDPTPTRMAIVGYLRANPSKTAATIASDVPGISRGSVYTTLNRLVDLGMLSSSVPAKAKGRAALDEPRLYSVTARGVRVFEVWVRALTEIAHILA